MQPGLRMEGAKAEGLVLEADGPADGAAGVHDRRGGDGCQQDTQGERGKDFEKREGGNGGRRLAAFAQMDGNGGGAGHGVIARVR